MKRNRLISAVCVLSLALSLCAGGCSEKKEETEARLSELEHLKEEAQTALNKVNQGQVELNAELDSLAQELIAIQKELEQFSDDPDTLIERLREDYVGLMQEEAKVSNSLTQVTHDMDSQTQALEAQAEEYKQAQADLLSAQEVASETQKAYQQPKPVFKTF